MASVAELDRLRDTNFDLKAVLEDVWERFGRTSVTPDSLKAYGG